MHGAVKFIGALIVKTTVIFSFTVLRTVNLILVKRYLWIIFWVTICFANNVLHARYRYFVIIVLNQNCYTGKDDIRPADCWFSLLCLARLTAARARANPLTARLLLEQSSTYTAST